MKNPAFGKQTVETTYTYDGIKDIDGTKYAVIKPQLKMAFEGGAEAQQALTMKIADQTSDGEVLFNIDKGRLSSTKLNQNVSIDATVGGKSSKQKIEQKIEVKVSPAGEKKPDDEAAANQSAAAKDKAENKEDKKE